MSLQGKTPRVIPFGRYDLLEKIAAGGMAEVWRARERGSGELVAVKRILPAIAADHAFITMFLDEARVSVQLGHPGVVQIRDLGEIDGNYFIAMEYVGGQSLRAILERERRRGEGWTLPSSFAAQAAFSVCEALDYVHRKRDAEGRSLGIVHRDVSPENVLVSYDGDVKLIDFGIAKASTTSNRTRAGLIKGKLAYLSPEQSRGLPIDGRSDVFSLGAVLFELLTGERLFLAENEYGTVMAVRERPVRPPSQLVGRIPRELDSIVMRALERNLGRRYQSAADMAEELRRFVFKQTAFGRDGLAVHLQTAFAEEWHEERAALVVFGRPPLAPAVPAARDVAVSMEKTEPHGRSPFLAPAGHLPPRGKRTSSFKTLLIPVLEATNVVRRAITRPPDRVLPPAAALPPPSEAPSPQRNPLPRLLALLAAALGVVAVAAPRILQREARGYLVVNAAPVNAALSVDGVLRGGPLPLVVELSEGAHRVHLEAPGFMPYDREVYVRRGAQAPVDVSLSVAH
ncbi:MAG: serine/threonine-protein kinase [Myxococcales bacterium]